MSGFSFNFSGDDIDDEGAQDVQMADTTEADHDAPPLSDGKPAVPVRSHSLQELVRWDLS